MWIIWWALNSTNIFIRDTQERDTGRREPGGEEDGDWGDRAIRHWLMRKGIFSLTAFERSMALTLMLHFSPSEQ